MREGWMARAALDPTAHRTEGNAMTATTGASHSGIPFGQYCTDEDCWCQRTPIVKPTILPTSNRESLCACCGMSCTPAEYHPYAACLIFQQCHNSTTVRANLHAVLLHGRDSAGETKAKRGFLGSTADGGIDDADREPLGFLTDLISRADERNYSDEWLGNFVRANLAEAREQCGELNQWRANCTGKHGSQMPCVESPAETTREVPDGWAIVPREADDVIGAYIPNGNGPQARDFYRRLVAVAELSGGAHLRVRHWSCNIEAQGHARCAEWCRIPDQCPGSAEVMHRPAVKSKAEATEEERGVDEITFDRDLGHNK
jgi:hypothetical protein